MNLRFCAYIFFLLGTSASADPCLFARLLDQHNYGQVAILAGEKVLASVPPGSWEPVIELFFQTARKGCQKLVPQPCDFSSSPDGDLMLVMKDSGAINPLNSLSPTDSSQIDFYRAVIGAKICEYRRRPCEIVSNNVGMTQVRDDRGQAASFPRIGPHRQDQALSDLASLREVGYCR